MKIVSKVVADPKLREANVRAFKDIKTLKRMMSALSADLRDYNRTKSYSVAGEIDALKKRLTRMRQQQRNREGDRLCMPKNFALQAEAQIRYKLLNLVEKRKFSTTIVVGGKETGGCEYLPQSSRYSRPTVTFCVGHLWDRNVFQNFYSQSQMVSTDYIILSAVEYRTNVQHIRLFKATAYGITEKKRVDGWVGQSKIGKQKACFRQDRQAAIQMAQKLTVGSVNEHLKGETSHD